MKTNDPAFDIPMNVVGMIDQRVLQESKKPCPHGKGIKFDCSFCALEFLNILIEERKAINH